VWTFKVLARENINTGMGPMAALHLVKVPAPESAQHIDLWLAPGHEWYPVKLRFSEEDGEFVQQTVDKITKK
jgi:hypothetical protein